ncbi:restriction endonuclease subunit S [Streptomyces sp. NBC_01579]|uniref:restriction endonuclease subunit S n=1 Tax=Streptomyces sp. NBC_01579 TaxID=2975885 RepID=UPI0038651EAB
MGVGGLPEGWAWVELGEIATSVKNGMYVSRPGTEPNGTAILRIGAVRPMRLSLDDLRYTGLDWQEVQDQAGDVMPGDLLFTRYNGNPEYVGAGAVVPDGAPELAYPDKLIRVRVPAEVMNSRFLAYAWASPRVREQVRGQVKTSAGQAGISGASLKRVRVPVPPLAEQHRIVEALEEQLSRLDVAERTLQLTRKRIEVLRKRVFTSLVPDGIPAGWTATTVGEAGTLELGRARHPDWHNGPEMHPYLRVANVFEDRIDTSSVMEMDFSGIFEKYKLHEGDILLNEGQSPHLVGRPAMYRGVPENVAFTNSLLRFKAGPGVLPEWALMVFRRHLHARRFMREVRITTNIAHLSSKRLKVVEFPIPPLETQKELIQRCDELLSGVEAISREVEGAARRSAELRSALLRKAFNGNLLPQDPADESASVLLARIAVEREAAKPARKVKSATRPRKAAVDKVIEPAPAPTSSPSTTVQQELFQ